MPPKNPVRFRPTTAGMQSQLVIFGRGIMQETVPPVPIESEATLTIDMLKADHFLKKRIDAFKAEHSRRLTFR